MNEAHEEFSPVEAEAAERLDRAIDEAAAGKARGTDPAVAGLLLALRADVPEGLQSRVGDAVVTPTRRVTQLARLVAAALAAALVVHGLGNLVNGRWVADHLGEPYGSHAFREGGLAFLALAAVLALASWRRLIGVAVAAGSPVGVALGVQAAFEAGEFPAGGVLHGLEGVLAVALLVVWWLSRRYASPFGPEEGT